MSINRVELDYINWYLLEYYIKVNRYLPNEAYQAKYPYVPISCCVKQLFTDIKKAMVLLVAFLPFPRGRNGLNRSS